MAFFDTQFPNANFAIAAFIETHHKSELEFPDEIREYMVTHHLIHTPTQPGETHNGIIVLVNKDYDILNTNEVIPGTLLNLHIQHTTSKTKYNLSAFYGPRWTKLQKTDIIKVLNKFDCLHIFEDNNIKLIHN